MEGGEAVTDDIADRVAAYRALTARVGETPVCGCCSEALVDEHFSWTLDTIQALQDRVHALEEENQRLRRDRQRLCDGRTHAEATAASLEVQALKDRAEIRRLRAEVSALQA